MPSVSPIIGWALDCAVEFDRVRPGFVGAFLRASNERRQVMAAFMSVASILRASLKLAYRKSVDQAEFLMSAGHRDILAAAFGNCPAGLRGGLARSGPQPHSKLFYGRLHRMLAAPAHAMVPVAIQQAASVDVERLGIIELLPADLCHPSLVARLADEKTAQDVVALVALLAAKGADRRALCDSLSRITGSSDIGKALARWATRIELPAAPIGPDDRLHSVRNGDDLRRLAVRFRNCARRYLLCTLDGTSSFVEYRVTGDRGAVIHLEKRGDVWITEDIYGHRNREVAEDVRQDILDRLEKHGIRGRDRTIPKETEWSPLRRLTSRDDYLW